MTRTILHFVDLLLFSLLVGTMFGIWMGFNPASLSPGAYVEHQQQAIRALNTPMPIAGAICIVLTIALAVIERGNRRVFALLLAAAACAIAAGAVTRFLNQPINSQVMTWMVDSPPADWTELRDRWWQWHIVRTIAGIAGLSCLILSALVSRRIRP